MADRLAALMSHFPAHATVFNTGAICGFTPVPNDGKQGQMHLLRHGSLDVRYGAECLRVDRPSLILFARPVAHQFVTHPEHPADMVCANLSYEGGPANPIASSMPEVVALPLAEISGAAAVLELLFEEAFEQRCGRLALIERLFEVVMIQVLRHLMESGEVQGGLLSGLAHPRLRHAMVAMHDAPTQEWTLDELAAIAGMSRSVFAATFREIVGVTPGQYLQGWRVRLAQKLLLRGRPLKVIADEVGYGSEAALSRAFKAQAGLSPRQWRAGIVGSQHIAALES